MRLFRIERSHVSEVPATLTTIDFSRDDRSFLWLSLTRDELRAHLPAIQRLLQARCDVQLVDLHVSDLLNDHLPSRYDYTSQYDVLVFRRL
ncbi:MAG: magnesium transporter CorA, partial [Gammaproteobacteria bacterium]|nr:magnesium transporter CorA [Gammaproteobacteria bacterium]